MARARSAGPDSRVQHSGPAFIRPHSSGCLRPCCADISKLRRRDRRRRAGCVRAIPVSERRAVASDGHRISGHLCPLLGRVRGAAFPAARDRARRVARTVRLFLAGIRNRSGHLLGRVANVRVAVVVDAHSRRYSQRPRRRGHIVRNFDRPPSTSAGQRDRPARNPSRPITRRN